MSNVMVASGIGEHTVTTKAIKVIKKVINLIRSMFHVDSVRARNFFKNFFSRCLFHLHFFFL